MRHATDRQLSALLDNELPERKRARIEHHIESCPECKERLSQYRRMHAALSALPVLPVDEQFALTRIRARVEESGDLELLARRSWYHPALAIAVAALVAIAVLFAVPGTVTEENSLDPKAALTQGPLDNCVAEQETDDIIRGYQSMKQLYYF